VRKDDAACERLADRLSAVPGVREVRVRPYTASALIVHGSEVALQALLDVAQESTGADQVLRQGEPPPFDLHVPRLASIAGRLATIGRELDRDLLRASGGSVDLGTLATLSFITAGAAEIVATRSLPMPPWFNLAWWGFRTFMTAEQEEIEAAGEAPVR
jgi:hypothetical protein